MSTALNDNGRPQGIPTDTASQRSLSAALAAVHSTLEQYIAKRAHGNLEEAAESGRPQGIAPTISASVSEEIESGSSELETLCTAFGLSPFERDILVLCAGMELDSTFASLCATAQDDTTRAYPTFSLAMVALDDAHWSAFAPNAPLRHWRLIEVGSGSLLTLSPLRIDERVLHYLVGVQHLDERLVGLIEPLRMPPDLVPSHHQLAERIATIWAKAAGKSTLPIIQLCGNELASKRAIAATACAMLGLNLGTLAAHLIPQSASELDALLRLWEREAALSTSALLLDCNELDSTDTARSSTLTSLCERIRGGIIISSRERRHLLQRPIITFDVHKPASREQYEIWQNVLGDTAEQLNGQVQKLVSQFSLSTATIHAVGSEVLTGQDTIDPATLAALGSALWESCRVQARPRLEDLAQRIEPVAGWDDLVLPTAQRQALREIAAQVRQRARVYETWGFASKSMRGMGISALFAGSSGTGKTMAAEVIANELRLDLYHIDLSQIVSKYIGETEKNLRRVFDAAEEGGAILLFDEADALFGKRSDVKDSHDRYANIEVSYLLQRMESYRGLAILTTNMKNALDTAFLRRIRFIVHFPFPDASHRAEIWRRIFPANTPTKNLDIARLARLNVAGGNIRNIALNAAFLAADADEPVGMSHLLRTARSEYAKLEKALTEAEIGGWV